MGINTLRNSQWSQRAQQRVRSGMRNGLRGGVSGVSGIGGLRIGARGGPRTGAGPGRPAAGRPRNPQAAVYWRRRFVALVVGLGVLALIGWAFSGAVGGSGAAQSGSGSAGSGQPGGGIQGGAGSSAGSANPREAGATAGQGGVRSRTRLPSCYRGDVVLSLFSSQSAYSSGELPQFSVDVVTTARQTCTFNVGADHIALVIQTGSTQVWSSTDCVQGAGNLVSDLQRGVPTVVPISWNLEKSSPGCPAAASRMPAGTYTAVVIDGALQSNSVTFRVG
jgi:hypothetical protein